MFRIGLISDTHGFLDPKIPDLFRGVAHILHAGDIGLPGLILELADLAPVTAVCGNTDVGLAYRALEVVELAGRKCLVHHILDLPKPAESIRRRIQEENATVVVFGHTHRTFCETIGGVLYVNPGYAGGPKHHQARTVAILNLGAEETWLDVLALD